MRRAGMAVAAIGAGEQHANACFASLELISLKGLQKALLEAENLVNPYLERNIAIVKSEQRSR